MVPWLNYSVRFEFDDAQRSYYCNAELMIWQFFLLYPSREFLAEVETDVIPFRRSWYDFLKYASHSCWEANYARALPACD